MKPYYVIKVDQPTNRENVIRQGRQDFLVEYDEDQPRVEGLGMNTTCVGINTAEHADLLLAWLTNRYPNNSYMIVKSIRAGYREPGPLKFGVFTEEGFMPA